MTALLLTLCLPVLSTSVYGRGITSDQWTFGGHTKYQYIHTRIPHDSILQQIDGSSLQEHNLEARLKASIRQGNWSLGAHLQFVGTHSDTLDGFRDLQLPMLPSPGVLDDKRRWFDLTHELRNQGKNASVIRLDRASVAYTGNKTVIRFGRQAISWGNGLLFTPMDIFNPFDPTAVDKEYKAGDDMLYAQYLFENGNDFQAVAVVRRNLSTGEVKQDESSLAIKYHGFWGSSEVDLLLAEHYAEHVIGLGLSTDLGGAVWRGDLTWSETESGPVFSAVAGASYSGVMHGHNWTGFLEYFYNGFGLENGDYSALALTNNPDLIRRLGRGEVFNLGRHYLGASLMVELNPLLNLTPNIFVNLEDPSAFAQLVLSWDWQQDLQLISALNLPVGSHGSEYGGPESAQPGLYVSTGASLFAQLAWYF